MSRNWRHYWIGLCLLAYLAVVCAGGSCSHLTVAPKPVVAHSISFSGNVQNGGVIDCDKDGCIVTPSWLEHYWTLEAALNQHIDADKKIKPEGDNWRISYETMNHYLALRAAERGA